jgi:hypothetical protein
MESVIVFDKNQLASIFHFQTNGSDIFLIFRTKMIVGNKFRDSLATSLFENQEKKGLASALFPQIKIDNIYDSKSQYS